jgi:hypothetical protein
MLAGKASRSLVSERLHAILQRQPMGVRAVRVALLAVEAVPVVEVDLRRSALAHLRGRPEVPQLWFQAARLEDLVLDLVQV